MTVIIPNLAIAGYRSFGKQPQYFDRFRKINLIIGQNNAGKSNVVRFLAEVYQPVSERKPYSADPLAAHMPSRPATLLGIAESFDASNPKKPRLPDDHRLLANFLTEPRRSINAELLGQVFQEKAKLDGSLNAWTLTNVSGEPDIQGWTKALQVLEDRHLSGLWTALRAMSGGDRRNAWEPDVAKLLAARPGKIKLAIVPAIRQVGPQGSVSEAFDGDGLIERLARLQNPDVLNQQDRQRFDDISRFLQTVMDRPNARIEIPYQRDTILVHMDGKVLPIESLGSGIHEVIILAAAATVLTDHVVCLEEPELHLNPILQRKLMRYLSLHTDNQYFITTHSATLMDTPDAEIYHIRLVDHQSVVDRVTSNRERSAVCHDLGYHPSDLLQANCVIWVEGPSDRIYLNHWIKAIDADLVEGIHYGIMFYGGRLASHLSGSDDSLTEVDDFISLRRLNRRGVIVIDSDRESPTSRINATKKRLQVEFDSGPGHAWITSGREIENYLPAAQLAEAIKAAAPKAKHSGAFGKFDNTLKIEGGRGKPTQASKVEVARYIAEHYPADFTVLDIKKQVDQICRFIHESNPTDPT